MGYLKNGSLLIVYGLFLLNGFFSATAQTPDLNEWVYENWYRDKKEVFEQAKAQDRYILLFIGLQNCAICNRTSTNFGMPENALSDIVDANFIPWAYKTYLNNPANIVDDYVRKMMYDIIAKGATQYPGLVIVNPDNPDMIVKWISGESLPGLPTTVTKLKDFITVDLLSGSKLVWRKDREEVIRLAKEQNKFVFKLTGRGTSPNSQETIKQLNDGTLMQLLGKTYILWYSDESTVESRSAEDDSGEEIKKPLPYFSVIHPEAPDDPVEELYGLQELEDLENLISKYTVSNEAVTTANYVSVVENVLVISNQINNEQINVYTLNGQNIASIHKNGFTARINASSFTKGIIVIQSSAGWTAKLLLP